MKKGLILLIFLYLWLFISCAASHYNLGRRHLEAEEYDEALAELELAKKENPDDPRVFRDLGIAQYSKLDFGDAIQNLLQAFFQDSTDGRTLFYLGTAFEITKKYDMAMDIYRRYTDVNPSSNIRSSIEGRMEKLMRLKMEMAAEQALAEEASIQVNGFSDSTIAVLYFQNMGKNPELDPVQKGLADMVITDLSRVKKLKVVERLRLQKLLEEMNLGMTGLVDDRTAPRIGKLLGASLLVKGTFMDLTGEKLRIDAGLIPVKKSSKFQTSHVEDQLQMIFKMEKELVFKVIERLGIRLTQEERDAIEIPATENLLAFMAYSNALDYEDRGMYDQAAEFYREAIKLDPNFTQVQEKLTVSENLSVSTMDAAEFEQQLASPGTEYTASSTVSPSGEAEQKEPSGSAESTAGEEAAAVSPGQEVFGTASTQVMDQMIHTSTVLDQGFLPGLDSRKPAQEQSQPTFGGTVQFEMVIPLPLAERTGGGQ
jgi:tetratricopeptide (TPR) repeat protein